jgi:hypothetical protein
LGDGFGAEKTGAVENRVQIGFQLILKLTGDFRPGSE